MLYFYPQVNFSFVLLSYFPIHHERKQTTGGYVYAHKRKGSSLQLQPKTDTALLSSLIVRLSYNINGSKFSSLNTEILFQLAWRNPKLQNACQQNLTCAMQTVREERLVRASVLRQAHRTTLPEWKTKNSSSFSKLQNAQVTKTKLILCVHSACSWLIVTCKLLFAQRSYLTW